jgi:glycine hydroxymethyltransferase
MVPFNGCSPFNTSGLLAGTLAINTYDVKEDFRPVIVDLVNYVLSNIERKQVILPAWQYVNTKMKNLPLLAWDNSSIM